MKTIIKLLITVTLFTVFPFFIFSADNAISKSEISRSLYKRYKKLDTNYKALSAIQESAFPHNVEINLPGTEENSKNTVIFAFTQEFAWNNLELVDSFIEYIKENPPYYNSIFLFTACDTTQLSNNPDNPVFSGTDVYVNQMESHENTKVIVFIDTNKTENYRIISGGGMDVSPRWMVKAVTVACDTQDYPYSVANDSIMMYKKGLVKENKRVNSFLAAEIPAIGLEVSANGFSKELFTALCKEINENYSNDWDRNYSLVYINKLKYWPGELFNVILYLAFSFITLCIVIFMIFWDNKQNKKLIKRIKYTWFFVPATILLTFLVLELTQLLHRHTSMNPTVLLGIKVISVFTVVMIVYLIQIYFNFRISFRASGYYLILIGAINLFVFTTLDISLLFVFFEEFILIYLCKLSKRHKVPLIIFSVLMIAPFIPYLKGIHSADSTKTFELMAYTSASTNFLFSLVLYPFLLEWSRIIMVFNPLDRTVVHTKKQYLLKSLLIFFISIITISALFSGIVMLFIQTTKDEISPSVKIIETQENNLFTAEYNTKKFGDLKMEKLIINGNGELSRINVKAVCSNGAPIFGSNYDYVFAGSNEIYFIIPDNACETLEINFRSDSQKQISFIIEAYKQTEEYTWERQITRIDLKDNQIE